MKKHQSIILVLLLVCLGSKGQCPETSTLWKRLIYLRDVDKNFPAQIAELTKTRENYRLCAGEVDSTYVLLLERLARAYSETADLKNALACNNRAIKIISDNFYKPAINPAFLVICYYRAATIYGSLRGSADKMRAYDSCLAVARRLKRYDQYSLYALREKVSYLIDVGEYTDALEYATTGEYISAQLPAETHNSAVSPKEYVVNFTVARINVLLLLKRYQEAEVLLTKAISICADAKLERYLGSLYHQLADAQAGSSRFNGALVYLNRALYYNIKWGYLVDCKAATANIAYNYYVIGKDYKKALYYYNKALSYHNTDSHYNKADSLNSLNIFSNIAVVYGVRNMFDSAHYFFQRAFDHIKLGTNEEEVLHSSLDVFVLNQKVEYLTSLFIDKGDVFFNEYKVTKNRSRLTQAIRMYRITDSLLEKIKSAQSDMQSKLFWRNHTHRLYESAIEACLVSGNAADAFYFFERSRAILLNDQLNEKKWLGEDMIMKQAALDAQILQMDKQLGRLDQQSRAFADLQSERLARKEELNGLIRQIRQKNELRYQSIQDTGFTTLADMRRVILKEHQALVEIFTGDSTVFTLVITPRRAYYTRVKRSVYDRVADSCMSMIADPVTMNRQFPAFTRASASLYRLMFRHIPLPDGRIVISPDGKYFPFEALVTGMTGGEPVYFLNRHAVSYTYSARYLMNRFAGSAKQVARSFLGMAPVHFPNESGLANLNGSDRSVRAISTLFADPDTLLGRAATRKAFLDNFSRHQIIQLYTHSSDSSKEGEPVIYFADSPLYLSALSSKKKPITSLVVLSACETGNGRFFRGEGVFSFNRAFAALGIPSCINTLWSVDNEATYEVTELFYRNLVEGMPLDVALQQAKLAFLQNAPADRQLPYYWAASILAGKTTAPAMNKFKPWVWIIFPVGAALLIFVAGMLIIRSRRSGNRRSLTQFRI